METTKLSNYDLLARLGFSEALIGENKRLGLKEKRMDIRDFVQFVDMEDDSMRKKNKFVKKDDEGPQNKLMVEENEDWKFIEITPPPKKTMEDKDLMKVEDLPPFARQAFGYTKTLNQIQSIVFPTAFKSSRSMIVAAPTGAGKTNIALLTILN
jgi:ATP-dependent helicase YprA (DUF1998 family)